MVPSWLHIRKRDGRRGGFYKYVEADIVVRTGGHEKSNEHLIRGADVNADKLLQRRDDATALAADYVVVVGGGTRLLRSLATQ